MTGINKTTDTVTLTYDPWCSACLDDAVGELECQGRRVVADREGVGADNGGGDGGEVVGEEGLGRGAAKSIHGGVNPIGALCGLGELLEEEDHCGREGAGGLGSEQVHEVALRQRVAVVAGRGVDPADPRATVEWRVGGQAHGLLTKDNGAQPLERIAKREGVAVGGGGGATVALRAISEGALEFEGGVAFPLVENVRGAEPVHVRDMPLVEVRVATRGLGFGAGRAIALVPEAHCVGGAGGAAYRGVDGSWALIVTYSGVAGVDCAVAKVIMLGDKPATLLARGKGDGEAGHVEAKAPLAQGAEVGGGDDGATYCGVREAQQEGASAGL